MRAYAATYIEVPSPHSVSFMVVGIEFFIILAAKALFQPKKSLSGPAIIFFLTKTMTKTSVSSTALAAIVASAAPLTPSIGAPALPKMSI